MKFPALLLAVTVSASASIGAQQIGERPLDVEVKVAIERGARWLLPSILGVAPDVGIRSQYPMGEDALCAYALIEAGVNPAGDQMRLIT